MKLVTGNSNRTLALAVSDYLELPLTDCTVKRFADQEVFVEIHENVRGEDVFVLQPTSFPANDNLMELLVLVDALRRSSARRITAVVLGLLLVLLMVYRPNGLLGERRIEIS